jgi:hypothetical protein
VVVVKPSTLKTPPLSAVTSRPLATCVVELMAVPEFSVTSPAATELGFVVLPVARSTALRRSPTVLPGLSDIDCAAMAGVVPKTVAAFAPLTLIAVVEGVFWVRTMLPVPLTLAVTSVPAALIALVMSEAEKVPPGPVPVVGQYLWSR